MFQLVVKEESLLLPNKIVSLIAWLVLDLGVSLGWLRLTLWHYPFPFFSNQLDVAFIATIVTSKLFMGWIIGWLRRSFKIVREGIPFIFAFNMEKSLSRT